MVEVVPPLKKVEDPEEFLKNVKVFQKEIYDLMDEDESQNFSDLDFDVINQVELNAHVHE